jgi:hypothetical protein
MDNTSSLATGSWIKEFVASCEMVASQQWHMHESRISIAGNHNQITSTEDCNRLRLSMSYSDLLSV